MYYPLNVGRNGDEIKRLLVLLTADKHKVAMPLDWQEGDKVIVLPPKTVAKIKKRKLGFGNGGFLSG